MRRRSRSSSATSARNGRPWSATRALRSNERDNRNDRVSHAPVSIPDYIIERVVARRGSITLFERLSARNTALLAIDMQNAFMQQGMASYLPGATDLVPNINKLAAALRCAGGRVVWIRHTADPSWDVYGRFSKPELREAALASYTPGHIGHAIHASLAVEPDDMTIDKRRFSALI